MKRYPLALTGCLALGLAAAAAPAKSPVVAPLPVPDATLPLQFDLFVGPLSQEDFAKHKALLEKNWKIGRGHLPGNPFMFGFTLVNGRPIKPLSRKHAVHRARGFSIETTPDIGHCPYGTWWDEGVNHRDEFHAFTVERQGDVLRGACDLTATLTETDQAKVELQITWTAKIIGGTQVEGQAEVRWKNMVVTRPLMGIVRQGLDDLIDPLNCIYQFTGSSANPDSGAWAVVEVKEGKPVRSLGHVRGQSEIRLRQVNADSLRITRHDHGVNGWKADLDGSIAIEGGPTFALGGVEIGVNGIGWGGHGMAVRAYHPQHPVARDWEGLAKALFAQVPVPAEAAERAKRQAAEQPALPPPSAATKYHFKHRAIGWPMPYAFTYAPWLDFAKVEGAGSYRFVATEEAPTKPLPIVRIAPDRQYRPGKGVQATMLTPDMPPTAWLASDIIPELKGADPLTDVGGVEACRPESGSAFKVRGQEYRFAPMERRAFTPGGSVDLAALMGAVGGNEEKTIVLFAVWENAEVRHVRWLVPSVGRGSVELVLAGRRVNLQQIMRLEKGYYPLLVIVRKRGAHFMPLHPILETVGDEEVRSLERALAQPTPQLKTVSFVASTSTASLSPIWRDMTVGAHTITLTALDAAGQPLGEPQSRSVIRKPSFGERGAMGVVLPPDQAEQAALRGARVRSQRDLGLMPLWEHLVSKGYPSLGFGIGQMMSPIWLAVAIAGSPGYERDLARAVMSHYSRWLDAEASVGEWKGMRTFPMGIPYSYGSRYYYAPELYMPRRLDQYEFSRDPRTGEPALYEASLPEPAPQAMRAILQRLTKLQQPSGGWSAASVDKLPAPYFYSGASMWGIPWLDFNAGSFANIAGRLRTTYGCTGEALAMELKSQHWLDGNALRTGWWERQIQQGFPEERSNTAIMQLLPYLDYLLEYAPPQVADLDQAETLARFIEDCFITWENDPRFDGQDFLPISSLAYSVPVARAFLRLHQRTGDPLWLTKADALFAQRLRREDPVWGRASLIAHDFAESSEQPLNALKYLALRREIAAKPPAPADDPTQGYLVLTLDRLLDRTERAVVHLAVNGGAVRHAFATTPTRRPIDIDFTQPGRLHVQDSTILHHAVDASGLKIGKGAITGNLTVQIAGAKEPVNVTVALKPDQRLWRGTWTSAGDTGRAAVEVRPAVAAKPKRAHVELCNAVTGGEAWQNWAMAMWDLKPDGAVSGSWLGNNNAGWTAAVQESSLKVTGAQIEGVLKVAATWEGTADTSAWKWGTDTSSFDPDGRHTQEWREGKKAWLANWQIGPEGRGNFYDAGFKPFPPYVADNGNVLRYQTTFKPVTAGTYTYRFTGQRLGDVLSGTVTVKGPDGKERQTQFLGGVE